MHFQIRLYERRATGLCVALDTLRAALRAPSNVPLDRAGRRLLRRRDCTVRAELYHRRCDRRIHPGLAADRGGSVCAIDHVSADCRIKVCVMEMWKTAACADGKPIHSTWKKTGLSHILQTGFPQRRRDKQFTHISTTPAATIITATVLSSLNQVNKKNGNAKLDLNRKSIPKLLLFKI